MKMLVFVFLVTFAPDSDVPRIGFAPVTDDLATCSRLAEEGAAKMRAEGKVVYAFCKEIPAPGLPS